MALLPLESVRPTVPRRGQPLRGESVAVSAGVVERQLLSRGDVPPGEQRQPGNQRVHADRLHEQVGPARVVEEAARVPHGGGVHERLGDGAFARVLPHRDDVVIVPGSLGELSAPGLLQTDHLARVLAHKRPPWDRLERPHPPALVLCGVNLQPEPEPPLHHPAGAGVAAGAQGVALKHRGAVAGARRAEGQQGAGAVVGAAARPQAGAGVGAAGGGAAGAAGEGDLAGVRGAPWALDVIWGVLKRDNGQ